MNRPAFILAGLALLLAAITVALWPSPPPEDALGVIAEVSEGDEARSEASVTEVPQEEVVREELDLEQMGIEDALIVTVIDEYKRPVTDATVAITSPGELPIWIYDLGRKTNASGRAIFDRAKGIEICEEGGWDEVIIGVWDWKLRGFKVEKKVRLADYNAMTFELPGVQQILVKLHGFPDSMAPVLSPVEGSPNDAMEITGMQQADGWWRFDEPPLGEVWDLWYARATLEEGSGLAIPQKLIDLPGEIQFVGPGVPGEITRAESNLMDQPVVQGTLIDEEGKPFGIGRHERYLTLRGISDAGQLELQPFQFEYFSKGQFLAWPTGRRELGDFTAIAETLVNLGYIDESELPPEQQPMGLHQIVSLYFTWIPEMSRRGITSERLGTARDATLLMPMGQPGVKLGDVALSPENYLIRFNVVNEAGDPVADADIDLELIAENEPRGLRSTFLPDLETNAQGVAWLMAPNWEMVQRTARGTTQRGRPSFTGLRVETDSREYIEQDEVFPIGVREITITLRGGGTLIGDMTFSSGFFNRFRARALPAGSVMHAEDDYASDSIRPRRGRDTFRLRQLPEGTVDLVVNWGWSQHWPVYVERGILVQAGEETKLTTLATTPFDTTLRWVEVEVPEGVKGDSRARVRHDAARDLRYDTMVEAGDGVWRFPIPVGSSRWNGRFFLDGFEPFEANGVGPGRHQLNLKALRKLALRPTCGLEGYSDTWQIRVKDGGTQVVNFDRASGALLLRVGQPQTLALDWSRGNARFPKDYVGTTEITITEADLARGEVVIQPPAGW